jgi:hypothetical protein
MKIETFQDLLDRFGSDFTAWPESEARQAKMLLAVSRDARGCHSAMSALEFQIDSSRPSVETFRAAAVARRALAEVARYEARPTMIDRLRLAFATPLPRAAFAMSLAAMGFGIGLAVGTPEVNQTADAPAGPLTIASADDVLF